jgi:hypothetical protein
VVRIRIALLLVLFVLLLLTTGTSAQQALRYQVETGVISGGQYQLVSFKTHVDNVAAGGDYRLLGPAVPLLHGSGCCCTYQPCVLSK